MIGITGATGQLGQLTIKNLLNKIPADTIVSLVRSPEKAKQLNPERLTTTPLKLSSMGCVV